MQMQQLESTGMVQATSFNLTCSNGLSEEDMSFERQISEEEFEPAMFGLCDAVWKDVCDIVRQRLARSLKNVNRQFSEDYFGTLGWLLGFWSGAISLELVLRCSSNNLRIVGGPSSYELIIEMINNHPVLASDVVELKNKIATRLF